MSISLRVVVPLLAFGVFGVVIAFQGRAEEVGSNRDAFEAQVGAVAEQWESISITHGDTFATVLARIGGTPRDVLDVLAAAEHVFDFTLIRAGREFRYQREDGTLTAIIYDIDTEEMVTVTRTEAGFAVFRTPIPYTTTTRVLSGTIETSLYEAALASGMPIETVLEFAEVFGWTVDFATQVQKGDTFRILHASRTRGGVPAPGGDVLAGEFTNEGTVYRAFHFPDADGKDAWYDENGKSMVRQLLRAPLSYSHITSGFTYARFHPTLGKNTPHRAIDYAAPLGTPVRSVGNGTVTYAGRNGGYGISIDIRHNSTYETQYAHLSRIASGIRVGTKVRQGQVIGYVGSTGYSTGPHLHYQIEKHGTLINPLKLELPPGDPVPEARRAEFSATRDRYRQALGG